MKPKIFLLYLLFHVIYYILPFLFITESFAQSEVYLSVRAGGTDLVSVGLGGFESLNQSAPVFTVRKTVESDLNKSGYFIVKALPDSSADHSGGIFEMYKSAGTQYYLFGKESDNGQSVAVSLFDLNTAVSAFDGEYRIDSQKPWYTAHVIVDDLIEHFTGLRGGMASQIAFIRSIKDSDEVFLIDADGRNVRQLTYTKSLNLSPSWSLDGASIAFSSLTGNNWLIMKLNITTGQSVDISQWLGLNTTPEWSTTQADVLAFTSSRDGNAEIYTCRTNGSNVRRLTNNPGIDTSPTWSPDGSKIVFVSDRTGRPTLYIMNSDGTNPHRLTMTPNAYEDSPCWSPQGDRIAFIMMSDYGFDIATVSPAGNDVIVLTFGQGSNEDPHWSPDGLRLLFSSNRTGSKKLYIMNGDGSNVRTLTIDGNNFSPAWAPAVSGDDIRISLKQ